MQCPYETGENAEQLTAHVAGRLEGEQAAQLERHLEECPRCREMLEAQHRVWSALDEWQPESISADFDARLYRRIEGEENKSWWRQLFRPVLPFSMRPVLPLAAACLLLIAALLFRTPSNLSTEAVTVDAVDIEQVERALEDMEMLFVLDAEPTEEAEGPQTI